MPLGSRSFLRRGTSLVSSSGADFEDVMIPDRDDYRSLATIETLKKVGGFTYIRVAGDQTGTFVLC